MKTFFRFFLLIVILVLVAACSPAAQSMAVQLPPELIAVLGMVVMVAVTAAARWVGDKIGTDISGQAAQVAAAVSSVLVLAINYGLALIPAAYDNFISALFSFLIVFLGGTGFYHLFFRSK
jgi:hypothetical protein